MLYPRLIKKSVQRRTLSAFRGYEHRLRTSDGAFYETANLSCELYPLLSVRRRRSVYKELTKAQGMIEKDALAYIDAGTLYYNGRATELTGITDGEKQLVSMGAYICIFPDKLYYNTADPTDHGHMDAEWSYTGKIRYSMCSILGEKYPAAEESGTEPSDPADGDCWIDTSEHVLRRWNAASEMWTDIESVYLKLSFDTQGQIPSKFSIYDGAELSGSAAAAANGSKIIYALGGSAGTAPGFEDAESDWIVVAAEPVNGFTQQNGSISLVRGVPDMDYVCQCGNRLWGCRYGNDGKKNINELYCCALGDFKNWSQYMGLSTDSWRASVGSDGVWTGAVNYLGTPLFFKENCIHKLYGTKPSDYQMSSVRCRGVAANAANSLCVIAETLYYLSPDGVMAWDGSLPTKVSSSLDTSGLTAVDWAMAGSMDMRYYLYLHQKAGGTQAGRLLVYDTEKGLWHEESAAGTEMVSTGQQLYLWDGSVLWAADPDRESGTEEAGRETALQFEAVSGDIGLSVPDDKYISRVTVRLDALAHPVVTVAASYDGGAFETLGTCAAGKDHQRINLPFVPRRADTLQLKIYGTGQMVLRSVAFTLAAATGGRVSAAQPRK